MNQDAKKQDKPEEDSKFLAVVRHFLFTPKNGKAMADKKPARKRSGKRTGSTRNRKARSQKT